MTGICEDDIDDIDVIAFWCKSKSCCMVMAAHAGSSQWFPAQDCADSADEADSLSLPELASLSEPRWLSSYRPHFTLETSSACNT